MYKNLKINGVKLNSNIIQPYVNSAYKYRFYYHQNPIKAKALLMGFEKSQEKGKNWDEFLEIIDLIIDGKTY